MRYPGLWARWCIYVLAGVAVVSSALTLPDEPTQLSALELGGLVLAGTAGYLFPNGVGPVGLWKSRRSFATPVLIALAFTSAPQVVVLAWIVIAVLSGVWIRRSRFSPGRMAAGASMITINAWVAAWTIHALDGLPLALRAVAGVLTGGLAGHLVYVVKFATALREPLSEHLWNWDLPDRAGQDTAGISLGLAAVLLRAHSPVALLLLALPYAATIATSLQRLMLKHLRRRDQAMATLSRRLGAASSVKEVEALLVEATRAVLDTPSARIGPEEPGPMELGVRWRTGWLVAEDRRPPPTFNRPYRASERAELEAIVSAGAAALENLALLERLERLSLEDELTGLPNRRGGQRALEATLAEARRSGNGVAVLLLDVDRFKAINDTHGHPFGDRVLAAVAHRLERAARAGETVARWGGEEFLAVVPCDPKDSEHVAERLRSAASGTLDVDGTQVEVTLSCGVAATRRGEDLAAQALVRIADQALYRAKAGGKDRTVLGISSTAAMD